MTRKRLAVREARDVARRDKVEHLVHNQDGSIGERNTYKRDPYLPRG